ncbi:hypothetical protein V6N13_140370 [Hibiscus sabdariffa]
MSSTSLLHQICKDKDEAKVWFTGLKALTSHGHNRKGRHESRSDGISSETTSPKEHTLKSSNLEVMEFHLKLVLKSIPQEVRL